MILAVPPLPASMLAPTYVRLLVALSGFSALLSIAELLTRP